MQLPSRPCCQYRVKTACTPPASGACPLSACPVPRSWRRRWPCPSSRACRSSCRASCATAMWPGVLCSCKLLLELAWQTLTAVPARQTAHLWHAACLQAAQDMASLKLCPLSASAALRLQPLADTSGGRLAHSRTHFVLPHALAILMDANLLRAQRRERDAVPAAGRGGHAAALHVPAGLPAAARAPGRRPRALRPRAGRARARLPGAPARGLAPQGALLACPQEAALAQDEHAQAWRTMQQLLAVCVMGRSRFGMRAMCAAAACTRASVLTQARALTHC